MPTALVPNDAIPGLAAQINSPAMLKVLRLVQKAGSGQNGPAIDQQTLDSLQVLVRFGLLDPGYSGSTDGPPNMWVINGNGERVLQHFMERPEDDDVPPQDVGMWLT